MSQQFCPVLWRYYCYGSMEDGNNSREAISLCEVFSAIAIFILWSPRIKLYESAVYARSDWAVLKESELKSRWETSLEWADFFWDNLWVESLLLHSCILILAIMPHLCCKPFFSQVTFQNLEHVIFQLRLILPFWGFGAWLAFLAGELSAWSNLLAEVQASREVIEKSNYFKGRVSGRNC